MPFDFQTNDYNTVLDSLIAGDYSITVRAENNVGLGPVSDPPVLVSVPNIGEDKNSVLYAYMYSRWRAKAIVVEFEIV